MRPTEHTAPHHLGTVVLQTPRLLLRPFYHRDAEAMFHGWANDPAVARYLTWDPHPSVAATEQVIDAWIGCYARPENYNWAITLAGNDRPIGSITVVAASDRDARCTIGYCIGAAHWNHGYTTEALAAVLDFLFEKVGYHRVDAQHDLDNPASGRVMEKCGMTFEGRARGFHRRRDQSFADLLCWSILREEWRARRGPVINI